MMDQQRIFELLRSYHEEENWMNKNIGKIDAEIKELTKKKAKYARMVSTNMRNRNRLINMIQR